MLVKEKSRRFLTWKYHTSTLIQDIAP